MLYLQCVASSQIINRHEKCRIETITNIKISSLKLPRTDTNIRFRRFKNYYHCITYVQKLRDKEDINKTHINILQVELSVSINKVLLEVVRPFCLLTVYGCLSTIIAKLSNC